MALEQEALQDPAYLVMRPRWPCKIVCGNQGMVSSSGNGAITFVISCMIARSTIRGIIGSTDRCSIAALSRYKGVPSLDERRSYREIVPPQEAHANAIVKISWPWTRGALSSHQVSSNLSRRAWACRAESDVWILLTRNSPAATSGLLVTATETWTSFPKASCKGFWLQARLASHWDARQETARPARD